MLLVALLFKLHKKSKGYGITEESQRHCQNTATGKQDSHAVINTINIDLNGMSEAMPINTPTAVPLANEAGEPCTFLNF